MALQRQHGCLVLFHLCVLLLAAPSGGCTAHPATVDGGPRDMMPAAADLSPGPTTAFATINTLKTQPVAMGLSGFSTDLLSSAVSYGDTSFQRLGATLSPGWLRFPGGTTAMAFDWSAGLLPTAMLEMWKSESAYDGLRQSAGLTYGKGGARLADFAAMVTALGAGEIVICVNVFTDTPDSARSLALYVRDHGIPVAAWELGDEPYRYPRFFATGAAYAAKVKAYRDAIKGVDAGAVVSVFVDGSSPGGSWDTGLLGAADRYWDALSYHHSPTQGGALSFADLIAAGNDDLSRHTGEYVSGYLLARSRPGVAVLLSGFDLVQTPQGIGTLYGGIYAAELSLRMSTVPGVRFVGQQDLGGLGSVLASRDHHQEVLAAAAANMPIDTARLDFGFYLSAQAAASAVANDALAHATTAFETSLMGGAMVRAGSTTIPALFGQAYQGTTGKHYLVITNKGPGAEVVEIRINGQRVPQPIDKISVSGTNPAMRNTADAPNAVRVQTQLTMSPLLVPPYSVVRLAW